MPAEWDESYRVVSSDRNVRVGVISCPEGSIIEVVVNMFPGLPDVDPAHIGCRVVLLKSLEDSGYQLLCDGDRFVCAELSVPEDEVEKSLSRLRSHFDTWEP